MKTVKANIHTENDDGRDGKGKKIQVRICMNVGDLEEEKRSGGSKKNTENPAKHVNSRNISTGENWIRGKYYR